MLHTYKCVQLTIKEDVVLNLRGSGGVTGGGGGGREEVETM